MARPTCLAALLIAVAFGAAVGCRGDRPSAPSPPAPPARSGAPAPAVTPTTPETALATARPAERPGEPPPTIDMHIHLTDAGAIQPLIETLDRHRIERAVVLGTQDRLGGRGPGPGLAGHTTGNAIALAAAKAHPGRLVPFAVVDLESDTVATLKRWRASGGCGFKIAQGDRRLRVRPLDTPDYAPLWADLAASRSPVLIHVNTTRFRAEFERVLRAHPGLNAVCAHWCSSRTDLDRFEAIAQAHPALLFDTSSGGPGPSAAGTANLSAHRERVRALVERWPERFLFGSDLVTHRFGDWRVEWADQIEMDRQFLLRETVRSWVPNPRGGATIGAIPGLALEPALVKRALADNARRWLASCSR